MYSYLHPRSPSSAKKHTKNTTNSDTAFWKHIKQIISWMNGDRKQQNSVCNFHISFQYFLTEPTANFTQRPRRTTLSHSYASLHGSPVGITINNWSRYFYTARQPQTRELERKTPRTTHNSPACWRDERNKNCVTAVVTLLLIGFCFCTARVDWCIRLFPADDRLACIVGTSSIVMMVRCD